MEEQWKTIPAWPDYAVSTFGRVMRLTSKNSGVAGAMLSQFKVCGYPSVNLCRSGQRQSVRVHRLVAEAFIPRPVDATEVNHIDASRTNNHMANLEWVSASQNRLHGYVHGACDAKGERNGHSKLTAGQVKQIRAISPKSRDDRRRVGAQFHVSAATVRDVVTRRTWGHI